MQYCHEFFTPCDETLDLIAEGFISSEAKQTRVMIAGIYNSSQSSTYRNHSIILIQVFKNSPVPQVNNLGTFNKLLKLCDSWEKPELSIAVTKLVL